MTTEQDPALAPIAAALAAHRALIAGKKDSTEAEALACCELLALAYSTEATGLEGWGALGRLINEVEEPHFLRDAILAKAQDDQDQLALMYGRERKRRRRLLA